MLIGHGDDIYGYPDIRMNFSSNILQHADHSRLKAHLMEHFDVVSNYPEPEPYTLEQALAEKYGIDKDCVLVTNGATDAIYLIAQAYSHLSYTVLHPTFSEYEDACRMFRCVSGSGGVAWACNPNNPTGETRTLAEIRSLVGDHELLVIDQAYENYTNQPMLTPLDAVNEGNIIQMHSMTKTYAVPGLRLGYLTAAPHIIRHLRRFLRPWSVNALAVEAGLFLTEHDELLIRPDLDEAQRLAHMLEDVCGIAVSPTQTNFMLCRSVHYTAAELKERLVREHGILIRDASNFKGLTPHHFRIAAQLPEENDALVDALSPRTSYLAPRTSYHAPRTSHLSPRTSHLDNDRVPV